MSVHLSNEQRLHHIRHMADNEGNPMFYLGSARVNVWVTDDFGNQVKVCID